jgi:hypothetical protein
LGSGSSEGCCPICGSELVVLKYSGKKPDLLALVQSDGFCCFMGCKRAELHAKVVNGVDYHGKVYVVPIFHKRFS